MFSSAVPDYTPPTSGCRLARLSSRCKKQRSSIGEVLGELEMKQQGNITFPRYLVGGKDSGGNVTSGSP